VGSFHGALDWVKLKLHRFGWNLQMGMKSGGENSDPFLWAL
jgi:hypothetical protein